jgi:streptogramin lyase
MMRRSMEAMTKRFITLILSLSILAGLPSAASAAPDVAGITKLSGEPVRLALGPDGNTWVTISASNDDKTLARIKPGGKVKEFDPVPGLDPKGITAKGDSLWLTYSGGVIEVDPADPDNGDDTAINAIGDPRQITRGPDGKLWTASDDQLVSFDAANPAGFDTETIDDMSARDITASGGKLFIADFAKKRIVRSTRDFDVKTFKVGGGPQSIASGPDGSIAYGNPGTDPQTVGRISPGGGPQKTKAPGDPFGADFIDGEWYFAMFAKDQVGVLDQNGGFSRIGGLPNGGGPRYVTQGQGDTLWVGLEQRKRVAKITGL